MPVDMAVLLVSVVSLFAGVFMIHSSWYSQAALSSPTFILSGGLLNDGNRFIIDDFREAYYWL
jgi:dolichyl-diphosphooligosaccharide--protein glycosyltransferase